LTVLLLTTSVGWLAAGASARADDTQFGGQDWYVSATGVLALDNADVSGGKPSSGVNFAGGFRFNRWITAEAGAEWIHRIRYDEDSRPSCAGTGGGSVRFSAWQATVGSRLYFTESLVQPFVVAHGGIIQTRDSGGGRSCSGTGFVARLGGGVDVFVTNGLAISLMGVYVLPATGGAKDHDYISVGLGFTWY
jgi:hypothetical protein